MVKTLRSDYFTVPPADEVIFSNCYLFRGRRVNTTLSGRTDYLMQYLKDAKDLLDSRKSSSPLYSRRYEYGICYLVG
jgi:hypothetical protein